MSGPQQALQGALQQLATDLAANGCGILQLGACFAAGTKLLTPLGWWPVEDLQEGMLVLSRPEGDPHAETRWNAVEATFVRTGRVLHLHVGGEVIRTTPEHPFYVFGKGWTAAGALQAGDWLSTLSGGWAAVEEVYDTGCYETVYNVRVAEDHTYFVGADGWELTLWAHNAACVQIDRTDGNWNARVINGHDVYGTPQTQAAAAHAPAINAIIDALTADTRCPVGTYFVINRSWRTALDRPNVNLGTPAARDKPDILIVEPLDPPGTPNRRWRVHAIEVLSPGQNARTAISQLRNDYASINNQNGEIMAGTFAAVDPGVIPTIAW